MTRPTIQMIPENHGVLPINTIVTIILLFNDMTTFNPNPISIISPPPVCPPDPQPPPQPFVVLIDSLPDHGRVHAARPLLLRVYLNAMLPPLPSGPCRCLTDRCPVHAGTSPTACPTTAGFTPRAHSSSVFASMSRHLHHCQVHAGASLTAAGSTASRSSTQRLIVG
jgi:hypothetical protein